MTYQTQSTRVVVIGAGAVGSLALKQFKEDGFDVTGFEARTYVGGLWKDSGDESISIQSTTIFNSSTIRSQATATQIHEYLTSYASHFDLHRHIKLNTYVKHILRKDTCWELTLEDNWTHERRIESFDKVCIATGTFTNPRWPTFDGIEHFAGNVSHSIKFHDGKPFADKNVLVIGMHATAQDCVNSLAGYAKKVYMSHRHGVLFVPRFGRDNAPTDTSLGIRFMLLQSWFEMNMPRFWTWVFDKLVSFMSDKAFPNTPSSWGLRPAPSTSVSTPLMADTLWPYLQSGFTEPVAAVKRITGPSTIELTNGRTLTDIDAITYRTGYNTDLPRDLVPRSLNADGATASSYHPYPQGPGKVPHLFLNIFPLDKDEQVGTSLAFLGHGAFAMPGFSQFELHAMAISQVWQGNAKLPPHIDAIKWYEDNLARRKSLLQRYDGAEDSTFYIALLPLSAMMPWLDEAAGTGIQANLGGKFNGLFNWRTWKLWWNERELYDLMTKGVFSPACWKVFDMGKRKVMPRGEALRKLREANEAVERVKQKRLLEIKKDKNL